MIFGWKGVSSSYFNGYNSSNSRSSLTTKPRNCPTSSIRQIRTNSKWPRESSLKIFLCSTGLSRACKDLDLAVPGCFDRSMAASLLRTDINILRAGEMCLNFYRLTFVKPVKTGNSCIVVVLEGTVSPLIHSNSPNSPDQNNQTTQTPSN